MGLRFRKSISLGGARINISKKGIGASVGVKGARITKTADGKTRKTLSVPGTGISYVTESGAKKKSNEKSTVVPPTSTASQVTTNYKFFSAIFKVLGILLIVLSLLLWIVTLPVGILFTLFGVGALLLAKHYKKRAKEQKQEQENEE